MNTINSLNWLRWRRQGAMTIVEIMVGLGILSMSTVAIGSALLSLNHNASCVRAMAAAKEVAKRNLERAMAVPYPANNTPVVLTVTDPGAQNGVTWNESAMQDGNGTVSLFVDSDNTPIISGTLRRKVEPWGTTYNNGNIRITFRVDYTAYGRAQTFELATIRSPDA